MLRRTLLAIALVFVLPASAGAAVIQDFSAFTSGTNGIALGPDGNFWVAEENQSTVARMTPAGDVIGRVDVGNGPTSIAGGPGRDRVGVRDRVEPARAHHRGDARGPPDCDVRRLPSGRDRRRREWAHVLLAARIVRWRREPDRVDRRVRHRRPGAPDGERTDLRPRRREREGSSRRSTTATSFAVTGWVRLPGSSSGRPRRRSPPPAIRMASRRTAPGTSGSH